MGKQASVAADVLTPIQRQAVLDFCRVEFDVASPVWNKDFLAGPNGFLFEIFERWVWVDPSSTPVEAKHISPAAAWKWCEEHGLEPPERLAKWHRQLPDATTMTYAITGSEPPWGPWLRAFLREHFQGDSAARAVGLAIAEGHNRTEVVEYVFTADLPADLSESEEKKWLRNALASAIKNLNTKLTTVGKKLVNSGDCYQVISADF